MSKNTILCFDFGLKDIGVAVGSIKMKIAHPLKKNIITQKGSIDKMSIRNIILEWDPFIVVVGLPMISKKKFFRCLEIFGSYLYNNFDVRVEFVNELLSTKIAKSEISENLGCVTLKRSNIHAHAASWVLDTWFKQMKNKY